jgi:hypothetical protein
MEELPFGVVDASRRYAVVGRLVHRWRPGVDARSLRQRLIIVAVVVTRATGLWAAPIS